MSDPNEDLLTELVAVALGKREAGERVDLAEVCKEHPELLPAVSEALGLAPGLPALRQDTEPPDGFAGRLLLGRYRLLERIGAGASGTVYRARDEQLLRTVAVKLLQRAWLTKEAEARFRREGEVLASLAHPHIVPVFDRGTTEDGIAFLVLGIVEGGSLAARIANQPRRDPAWVAACAEWGCQLAQALATAHGKGIRHRDVKPSNVLLDHDGRAMLVDFGIAARSGDGSLTATGSTLGTPWYMAPEQITKKLAPEPATDVYGLCATLYHALTLQPPYDGDAQSVLAKIPLEDPIPLGRLAPDVPRDLVAIVEHGLERDPRRRYPGAAQLEADLRAYSAGLPVAARPIGRLGRIARGIVLRPARSAAISLLVLALGLALVVGPLLYERNERARQTEKLRLQNSLPVLVTLEGRPEERQVADRAERDEALPIVDSILAIDPHDVPARLLRAALLFDSDQRKAATAEIVNLGADRKSLFFFDLAGRYTNAAPDVPGATAVRLEGLHEPTDSAEHYALGFHILRQREDAHLPDAEKHLALAAPEFLAARDLHLLALLAVANSKPARSAEADACYLRAYESALKLEESYGGPTARTRHAIGAALLGLRRYAEAVGPLEASLQLRGNRHNVIQNLAIAKYRLGQLDAAEQLLHQAKELKPSLWNTSFTLAQVLRDRERWDEARQVSLGLPERAAEGLAWKRARLLGQIEVSRGLALLQAGDKTSATAAARLAVEHYEAAQAAGASPGPVAADLKFAAAVAEGDLATLWVLYGRSLAADPLNSRRLFTLSRLLPATGIPLEHMNELRVLLLRLSVALAPDDPEPARELARPTRRPTEPKTEPGK